VKLHLAHLFPRFIKCVCTRKIVIKHFLCTITLSVLYIFRSNWTVCGRVSLSKCRDLLEAIFAGIHSVVCAEIFQEHQVIMIEIGGVKKRSPEETTYRFTSWWYPQGCCSKKEVLEHHSHAFPSTTPLI